jgi:hypothetical protein
VSTDTRWARQFPVRLAGLRPAPGRRHRDRRRRGGRLLVLLLRDPPLDARPPERAGAGDAAGGGSRRHEDAVRAHRPGLRDRRPEGARRALHAGRRYRAGAAADRCWLGGQGRGHFQEVLDLDVVVIDVGRTSAQTDIRRTVSGAETRDARTDKLKNRETAEGCRIMKSSWRASMAAGWFKASSPKRTHREGRELGQESPVGCFPATHLAVPPVFAQVREDGRDWVVVGDYGVRPLSPVPGPWTRLLAGAPKRYPSEPSTAHRAAHLWHPHRSEPCDPADGLPVDGSHPEARRRPHAGGPTRRAGADRRAPARWV